jgi:hypothetical protein
VVAGVVLTLVVAEEELEVIENLEEQPLDVILYLH